MNCISILWLNLLLGRKKAIYLVYIIKEKPSNIMRLSLIKKYSAGILDSCLYIREFWFLLWDQKEFSSNYGAELHICQKQTCKVKLENFCLKFLLEQYNKERKMEVVTDSQLYDGTKKNPYWSILPSLNFSLFLSKGKARNKIFNVSNLYHNF